MTTIKELKELDAKATSAPWEARRNICLCGGCEAGDIWRVDEIDGDCTVCKDVFDYHDHLLIAANRNALPDLIRVIELADGLINQGNFTYLGGEYVFCAKPEKIKELEEKIKGLMG